MTRKLLILALTPLLVACPPQDEEASVRWDGGRPVFDADRGDCLHRVAVTIPAAGHTVVWSAEDPNFRGSTPDCPLRFPVAYGAQPAGTQADPVEAPPLGDRRGYAFEAQGANASYRADFPVPAAE